MKLIIYLAFIFSTIISCNNENPDFIKKQKNKANFTDYFKKAKLRTSPKSPNGLTGRAGVIVQ